MIIVNSCKEQDTQTDCGCEGEIQFTIEERDAQSGFLYVNNDNSNDNVPDYNYGIWFPKENCSNCIQRVLICNDQFISDIKENLKYPGIEVVFSGTVKNLCNEPFRPAGTTYNYLSLSKIEKL